MNVHLAEISRHVTEGAHAVLVLDQAGWHTSPKPRVPEPRKSRCGFADISLLPLLPYAPELNPVEQVWACLRANFLSHRVWNSHNAIVGACCDAWNRLMSTPERLAFMEQMPRNEQRPERHILTISGRVRQHGGNSGRLDRQARRACGTAARAQG